MQQQQHHTASVTHICGHWEVIEFDCTKAEVQSTYLAARNMPCAECVRLSTQQEQAA